MHSDNYLRLFHHISRALDALEEHNDALVRELLNKAADEAADMLSAAVTEEIGDDPEFLSLLDDLVKQTDPQQKAQ